MLTHTIGDYSERKEDKVSETVNNIFTDGTMTKLKDQYNNEEAINKLEEEVNNHPLKDKLSYAIELAKEILNGNKVLLFIDEINRCEHTVQQELMNLILNREINGYKLHNDVKIWCKKQQKKNSKKEFLFTEKKAKSLFFLFLHIEI